MNYWQKILCILLASLVIAACSSDDPISSKRGEEGAVLPVVFHVLYRNADDPSEYIPASRFAELLRHVNSIYKGGRYGESVDGKVRFVLAQVDERGREMSVPGVHYVRWTEEYPIDCEKFMNGNYVQSRAIIWDPNRYVNVMVYPFAPEGDGNITLGLSHLPFTRSGGNPLQGLEVAPKGRLTKANLSYPHGVSINGLYVWKDEQGKYYQSSKYDTGVKVAYNVLNDDVVVTLAHELGHYIGLLHVFSDESTSVDPDYCDDTPTYVRSLYTQWMARYLAYPPVGGVQLNDLLQRTSPSGTTFVSTNVMDYAMTLGYELTRDQVQRIQSVISTSPLMPTVDENTRSGLPSLPSHFQLTPVVVRCSAPCIATH